MQPILVGHLLERDRHRRDEQPSSMVELPEDRFAGLPPPHEPIAEALRGGLALDSGVGSA